MKIPQEVKALQNEMKSDFFGWLSRTYGTKYIGYRMTRWWQGQYIYLLPQFGTVLSGIAYGHPDMTLLRSADVKQVGKNGSRRIEYLTLFGYMWNDSFYCIPVTVTWDDNINIGRTHVPLNVFRELNVSTGSRHAEYELIGYEVGNPTVIDKVILNINWIPDSNGKALDMNAAAARIYPYAEPVFRQLVGPNWGELAVMAPELELLYKAGYESLCESIVHAYATEGSSGVEQFNRLCKPGKNLKEIFKTEKIIYKTLQKERDLAKWDTYRKFLKTGKIQADTVDRIFTADYSAKELQLVYDCLGVKRDGKQLVTIDQLIPYCDKVYRFEAIPREDALQLFSDTLRNCAMLGMKPRLDSDSLKREHDVTSRICREMRFSKKTAEMYEPCRKLQNLSWSQGAFLVRGIIGYDDLIDEAKQQVNCLAAYADDIIAGKSLVYVVRRIDAPEKSFVTVELSPKKDAIWQRRMAYNQPVRNKSVTDFLDAWLTWIKTNDIESDYFKAEQALFSHEGEFATEQMFYETVMKACDLNHRLQDYELAFAEAKKLLPEAAQALIA